MNKRVLILAVLLVLVLLTLTGCIPGDGKHTSDKPAGFLWGVWHGWIAPISLIGGLFNKSLRVYETVNTGWWYDFGFYIAIISGFGGISLSRRSKSKD
ncbi:MAG: hypothetical protein ACOX25_09240 [Caldicoprobacterales bacterium]|nr:hypothetical protein [Clostridiales bacterium]